MSQMDQNYLSIFCPEHNQYVLQVCLVNSCYQKLLCDVCMKKHKEVHRNQQIALTEFVNNLKLFHSIKLDENEDFGEIQDQALTGQRMLKNKDGKQSQIQFLMLQCINGKDQELKSNLFNEKSLKKKTVLQEREVKDFTNGMQMFLQQQQRRILQFEKSMMESMNNQLKRATSKNVLNEKFLKDSAIDIIMNDLKDNQNRYNLFSKNVQKLHKGYLELKVSKKLFRDMVQDTLSRYKILSKNLLQFFDAEFTKQFSFMIDINEEIIKQSALDAALGKSNDDDGFEGEISKKIASPTEKSFKEMKLQFVNDKNNPTLQMTRMILDLEKINKDIKSSGNSNSIYPADVMLSNSNREYESKISSNQSTARKITYKQSSQVSSQHNIVINNNNDMNNNNSSILNNNNINYGDSNEANGSITNRLSKYQQSELLKKLDYQKKEHKINLEKIECARFSIIKNNCAQISNFFIAETSIQQASYCKKNDNNSDDSADDINNNNNNKNDSNIKPIQFNSMAYLFSTPCLVTGIQPNQSSQPQSSQSNQQFFAAQNKNIFRIHKNNSSLSSRQLLKAQPLLNSIDNFPSGSLSQVRTSSPFKQERNSSLFLSPELYQNQKQVSFSSPIEFKMLQSQSSIINKDDLKNRSASNNQESKRQLKVNVNVPALVPGFRDPTKAGVISPSSSSNYRKIIEVQVECDYKKINLLNAVTNPNIRVLGFLDQLKLTSSALANPISKTRQPSIKQQQLYPSSSVLYNLSNQKSQPIFSSQQSHSQFQQSTDKRDISPDQSYFIANSNSGNMFVMGIEAVSSNKFLVLYQNGVIQAYQINQYLYPSKIKEISVSKTISCYVQVTKKDKANNRQQPQQKQDKNNIIVNDAEDILLFISGLNEAGDQYIYIIKYEGKKNKFFPIDTIKDINVINQKTPNGVSISPPGIISAIECAVDKLFQKTNLPSSLILVTDAYYLYTLNLFDVDEEMSIDEQPTITVNRIQFHRDKYGSSDKQLITRIKIKHNVIIHRLLFDSINDCLWGNSDYMLFKWRINNQSKCTETQDSIILIKQPNDVITSIQVNDNIIMLTSLYGNIYGIDVMFNQAISKDCQRYKYVSINNYNKIQGKDPIHITSGSNVYTLKKQKRMSSTNDTFKSVNTNINNANNNENNNYNEQYQIQHYFIYSILSQAGAKLFCFDYEFKEVTSTISGQENHIQQVITLGEDNYVVALENFDTLRIWKNEFF